MTFFSSLTAWLTKLFKGDELLARYCIIGSAGLLVDFLIYLILVTFGLQYLISNIISMTLGLTTNLILNLQYNFKLTEQVWQRAVSYGVIGTLGIIISIFVLFIMVETYAYHLITAKLVTMAFLSLFILWLNSNISLHAI